MDDAMILPGGHSFGTRRMEHIMRMVSSWMYWYFNFGYHPEQILDASSAFSFVFSIHNVGVQ